MSYTNIYRIAERTIEITSIHKDVHNLCSEYRYSGRPDFSVITQQQDIDFERRKSADEDRLEGKAIRNFPDGYLETLAVYRKIAEQMLEYDTALFHGSVIAVDGMGYLFTAKSGTGKSTHTKLWREYFGERAVMVNDDKPLIRVSGNEAAVYGTPWDGKHRLSSNISVPLKALCILTRDKQNHIERISKQQAYPMLLQQIYRPAEPLKMSKTLEFIDRLAGSTSLYCLGCNMDIQAAEIAYNAMK